MPILTIAIYIGCIILGWTIFYFVVKTAVRNGIREARLDKIGTIVGKPGSVETVANTAQLQLQKKYDKGEISFADYQMEWKKLS